MIYQSENAIVSTGRADIFSKIIFFSVYMAIFIAGSIAIARLLLKRKSQEEGRVIKIKYGNLILALPIVTTIPCAFLFSIEQDIYSFFIYGAVAVILDYAVVGFHYSRNRERILKEERRFPLAVHAFLLLLPFLVLYAGYCFLFSMMIKD